MEVEVGNDKVGSWRQKQQPKEEVEVEVGEIEEERKWVMTGTRPANELLLMETQYYHYLHYIVETCFFGPLTESGLHVAPS